MPWPCPEREGALPRAARRLVLLFALPLLMAGCASTLAPQNKPLAHWDGPGGYRFANLPRDAAHGDTFVSLSFSGGGTRAAALAYGVLEELRRTSVRIGGEPRRLLDQVATISAVSGGSATAAYYGLFGERLFDDFERRFLKRDVQTEIATRMLWPSNLFRLTSPYFGRSDVTAEFLDDALFGGLTFGDMLAALRARRGPLVRINATDMSRTSRFEFTQEQFDLLCSDLSSYPVSRAVAASSAVPVVFSPITLKNYAGSCGFPQPAWIAEALDERDHDPRRYYLAIDAQSYLDAERRRFVHLLDGGLSDNLGLRALLDRVTAGEAPELQQAYRLQHVRRIVQIVVNAQTRSRVPDIDTHAEVPTLRAIAFAVGNTTDRYSIETLALVRSTLRESVEALRAERRARGEPGADDVQGYLVEVNFEALPDAAEREWFNELPTTFRLPDDAIDRLREAGARLLRAAPDFQRLLSDLR